VPELPEVETIRRDLEPEVADRVIVDVEVHKADIVLPPLDPESFGRRLTGRRVVSVGRRAKYLLFHLDDGSVLQVQLRMSGRFALGREIPDPTEFRHIAARLHLDDGRTLFYDDVRRLGGFRLLAGSDWEIEAARLGPEPLEPGYRAADLGRMLAATRSPVKNALMDQRRVAGVGNIYASEALWLARIRPTLLANKLSKPRCTQLATAVLNVLDSALSRGGTSLRDFVAADGAVGENAPYLQVYGREGVSCPRRGCPGVIRRTLIQGRATFHCPSCQKR